MIYYVSGDLLESDSEALVNAVNCVGIMGKGIALSFKKKFPNMFLQYKEACSLKLIRPGKVSIYQINDSLNTRYIINFPTKDHWRQKSRLSYISEGLKDLVRVIDKYHISSIAIPMLGCGNGGLNWNDVIELIEFFLSDLNCSVYVYGPSNRLNRKTGEL